MESAANRVSMSGGYVSSEFVGKVITCKAAVAWAPGKPLLMEEIQVDPPKAMEVRIKITHTSVCHTDITFLSIPDDRLYPRIFGHEGAGVVESVGDGVTDIKAGDAVVSLPIGQCGKCKFCKSEKSNHCEEFRFDATKLQMKSDCDTRFSINGKRIYGFMNTSTFSEYTVVNHACVIKVDPGLPLSKACLLGCGVSTGLGAAWYTVRVEAGSTVAIFGLGTIGFAVAEGARIAGASKIIGIDTNPKKFAKCKAFGITDVINPKEHEKPVHEIIKELTEGGGVDYCFECVGNAGVLSEALMSIHEGWGVTVLVGFDSSLPQVQMSAMDMFMGKRVVGSMFGGIKGKSHMPDIIRMCINKEVNLEEFVTHELPFSEINRSFELLRQGNCLRCVMAL